MHELCCTELVVFPSQLRNENENSNVSNAICMFILTHVEKEKKTFVPTMQSVVDSLLFWEATHVYVITLLYPSTSFATCTLI